MNTIQFQSDLSETKDFLLRILTKSLSPDIIKWIQTVAENDQSERNRILAFSMAPRRTGKSQLLLNDFDKNQANNIRKGWQPEYWTTEQATRVLIVVSFFKDDVVSFKKTLNTLFLSADVGELVALYSSLPLLPEPKEFADRASEGIRSNMTSVFDAVVLNNPYPSEFLSDQAWNQMVLKAIFVGRPLYKIFGLDSRRNPELARMVSDFAHERWAASRTVTPEAWRLVAPFLGENEFLKNDLKKVMNDTNQLQQEAATIVYKEAGIVSDEQISNIDSGTFAWQQIADAWYSTTR